VSLEAILPARRDAALFLGSLAAASALLVWSYSQDLPARVGVAYHHVASVRELARGEFPPANNLVPGHTPVGHYGPYLVVLGLVARTTGAEPLALLEAAGFALFVAYLLLFRALAARLVSPAAANWTVPATLLLWGPWLATEMPWVAWGWPGSTSAADAQGFFYPQHAAMVLLLLLLRLGLDGWSWPRSALLVVLAALLITTHAYTGLALGAALFALVLAGRLRRQLPAARAALLLLVPLLGLLLAGAWPYYPVWRLLAAFSEEALRQPLPTVAPAVPSRPPPQQASLASTSPSPAPAPSPPVHRAIDWAAALAPAWNILGPALLGLVGGVLLARRGQPFALLWSLVALGVALAPLIPLRERLVMFAATPLHLGAVALLERLWLRRWLGRIAVVVVLLSAGLVSWRRLEFVRDLPLLDLRFIAAVTPENAVIVAPDGLANVVAGQTGRKVLCPEGPDLFLIFADGVERLADSRAFYQGRTSPERREQILRRWSVTHVLVDQFAGFPGTPPGRRVAERDGLALYDVRELW